MRGACTLQQPNDGEASEMRGACTLQQPNDGEASEKTADMKPRTTKLLKQKRR
jgi:hypothetical protein